MEVNVNININNKTTRIDFILVAILFFTAILRFYHLDYQSAWLDEVHTMIITDPKFSFHEIHEKILNIEGTPHLFFLISRFLSHIFGHTLFVNRFPSALFGTLSVYYMFLLAKKMFNRQTGYIAAILLSVNLFHIEFSQEARAYAMMIFFIILAYYRLLFFIKDHSVKNAIFFGIFAGLIPNGHVFGVLNSASMFLVLLVILIQTREKQDKVRLFKNMFIAGIVALIVFSPVMQIITNLTKTQTHWIPAATFDGIKSVFIDLYGKSGILCITNLLLIVAFIGYFIYFNSRSQDAEEKNKLKLAFLITMTSMVMIFGVIIVKSYIGPSLILSRYFIGVLPIFILVSSFVLSLIPNPILRNSVVGVIVLFSLYNLFVVHDYYNRLSKAQFSVIAEDIQKRNPQNETVVCSFGWMMGYYFEKPIISSTLEGYVASMRNQAVSIAPFWYFDGNSKPYKLSSEDEQFLAEHFVVDQDLNQYFDTWAKHYALKDAAAANKPRGLDQNNEIGLFLNEFKPGAMDGSNLMMFENSTAKSPQIELKKGSYQFLIEANSLPETPIQGQNAHMVIKLNDQQIASYNLSEKPAQKQQQFAFEWAADAPATISLTFDNDIAADGMDRNVRIYSVKIKKRQ